MLIFNLSQFYFKSDISVVMFVDIYLVMLTVWFSFIPYLHNTSKTVTHNYMTDRFTHFIFKMKHVYQ